MHLSGLDLGQFSRCTDLALYAPPESLTSTTTKSAKTQHFSATILPLSRSLSSLWADLILRRSAIRSKSLSRNIDTFCFALYVAALSSMNSWVSKTRCRPGTSGRYFCEPSTVDHSVASCCLYTVWRSATEFLWVRRRSTGLSASYALGIRLSPTVAFLVQSGCQCILHPHQLGQILPLCEQVLELDHVILQRRYLFRYRDKLRITTVSV